MWQRVYGHMLNRMNLRTNTNFKKTHKLIQKPINYVVCARVKDTCSKSMQPLQTSHEKYRGILCGKLFYDRNSVRYHQVLLRARFDETKKISDPKDQRRLLWMGQDELFKTKHPLQCAKFATSLGIAQGVAYGRVVTPPDWVLDYWHPLEKAQYPRYFKTREKRKCEYIQLWNANKLR